jgi:arylsulfatase A-like enzyme
MRLLFFLLLCCQHAFAQQPNIIYIMSDDHDNDAISAYNKKFIQTPNIDRLAKEGIRFNKAFVGNSICSPARATLLTGQHSHKNAVKDNRTRFDSSKITMPQLMREAGYQTALTGKWHLHSYPKGFDYWKILPGQGRYYDPLMINMKGDTVVEKGYATDVTTNDALQWLDQRDKNKPFLLLLHHKAPHRNWMPRLKHLRITSKQVYPEPPTLYADVTQYGKPWQEQKMSIVYDMELSVDLKIDPVYYEHIPELKPSRAEKNGYNYIFNHISEEEKNGLKEIYAQRGKLLQQHYKDKRKLLALKYQWYMQDYMACVASVDENIGRLLTYLDKNGLAKNTLVIYTGDQGFYLGENGWFDKRWMYDVSMQAPLLMRWPAKIKPGTVSDELVQNIDFAPTIMDVAAVKVPAWMQGISLKEHITQQKKLNRDYLYYHYYEYPIDHYVMPHVGIRGKQYKLIYFYTVNEWELYDLQKDPAEQNNLIKSTAHQSLIKQLKNELLKLRDEYDDHEPAGELN